MNEQREPLSPTLFVGSLSPDTTERDLKRYFSGFGKILRAKLIVDIESGISKQCALIFCQSTAVASCILDMPRHVLDGRQIRIDPAADDRRSTKCLVGCSLFIGNFKKSTTEEMIRCFFQTFGEIIGVKVFTLNNSAKSLNAVVNFKSKASVDEIMTRPNKHKLDGRHLRCSYYKAKDDRSSQMDFDGIFEHNDCLHVPEDHGLDYYEQEKMPVSGSSKTLNPYSMVGREYSSYESTGAYRDTHPFKYDFYSECDQTIQNRDEYQKTALYYQAGTPWGKSCHYPADRRSMANCHYVLAVELEADPLFDTFCNKYLDSDQR